MGMEFKRGPHGGMRSYRPGDQPGGKKGVSQPDQLLARMEIEAETILENVMQRRRWTPALRQDLALALARVVTTETKGGRKQ